MHNGTLHSARYVIISGTTCPHTKYQKLWGPLHKNDGNLKNPKAEFQ